MPRCWNGLGRDLLVGAVFSIYLQAGMAAGGQNAPVQVNRDRPIRAQEIVSRMIERNRQRAAALEHYTTDRTYKIAYTGTGGDHSGELRVHAEYLGAERKRLTITSQTGSPFLCNKILKKLVTEETDESREANSKMMLTPANYDVALVGEEVVPGVDATQGASLKGSVKTWVLSVTPREDNRLGYSGRVWVSEDDYAIVRILGEPHKAPSFLMDRAKFDSFYARRGQVWLPARNTSSTHLRFGGDALLTIDYGSYSEVAVRAIKPPVQTAFAPGNAQPGIARAQ